MTILNPGANAILSQLKFELAILYPSAPTSNMHVFAFLLADGGKVRDGDNACFFGQPNVLDGAVIIEDTPLSESRSVFSFDLSKISQDIEKIAIVIAINDNQTVFGSFSEIKIEVSDSDSILGEIPCKGMKETALILSEIYRRGKDWKLRIVGQGFKDGLTDISQYYGIKAALSEKANISEVPDGNNKKEIKKEKPIKQARNNKIPTDENKNKTKGINQYLKENLKKVGRRTWITPEIPENKLSNAINAFKFEGDRASIIGICDNTSFGSAKEGFLVTGNKIIYKEVFCSPIEISYEEIESVEYIVSVNTDSKGKEKKYEKLQIKIKNKETVDFSASLVEIEKLAGILSGALSQFESYEEQNQLQPIEELAEGLKIAYIKIVVNMAFDNEGYVDDNEFAEILQLMTRLKLKVESRNEIRNYIGNINNTESVENLVKTIDDQAPDGMEKSLRISLVKDLISVNSSITKSVSSDFDFLRKHRDTFQLSDKEIELAQMAIANDRKILDRAYTDNAIEKSFKELSAKAGAVGVPLGAVYLSGSVMGLSAAGMTSGLAALGMGGILGLSSMATGIGAAVILGVVTYKGIKHLAGSGVDEGDARREIMLKEIIRQSQRTINIVIEDINFLTEELSSALKEADVTKMGLDKIAAKLSQYIRSSKIVGTQTEQAEADRARLKSPEFLDVTRLKAVTQDHDKSKYFDFIMGFYKEDCLREEKDDGELVEKRVLRLVRSHDSKELEKLGQAFDLLGYATTQGAIKAGYANTQVAIKEGYENTQEAFRSGAIKGKLKEMFK